jgi:serine O-acetyltransferase
MGTVIGETAEIGADVLLYHNVTLGGVDLKKAKRHPTVEDHVVIGAGAQVLGPIRVGAHSRVGANAVVVKDVPNDSVVVGVPGRARPRDGTKRGDAADFDLQHNVLHDTTLEMIQALHNRILVLEQEVNTLRLANHSDGQTNGYPLANEAYALRTTPYVLQFDI